MKKLLFMYLMVSTSFVFSQKINDEKNGYVEIVEVDSLKQSEIYQKIKEWVSLNYKSANDVVQLDTENQIIVKGYFDYYIPSINTPIVQRVTNTLIFRIKDETYKIELIPTEMFSPDYPTVKLSGYHLSFYIAETFTPLDKYKEYLLGVAEQLYFKMGYNEKKVKKYLLIYDKQLSKNGNITLEGYLNSYKKFQIEIQNIFSSIKRGVSSKSDEW